MQAETHPCENLAKRMARRGDRIHQSSEQRPHLHDDLRRLTLPVLFPLFCSRTNHPPSSTQMTVDRVQKVTKE